jgi:hypothetical protein
MHVYQEPVVEAAPPPSQQNVLADVMTPPSAAAIEPRSDFGSTASVVAPLRSRATMIGRSAPRTARAWPKHPLSCAISAAGQ